MELLLAGATEELQSLADELERAGCTVKGCLLTDAAEQLTQGDPPPDAVLLNLTDEPDDALVRNLLGAEVLPPQTPAIALVGRRRLPQLDPALPVDDFAVYPATADELLARIRRASWRRAGVQSSHLIRSGDLMIDQQSYKVFVAGRPVDLTYKEYELLRFLALNQDRVFTREALLNRVWGYDFYGGARTVDVHIRRLRSKIEDRAHTFIETVRNVGYRFHTS